MTRARARQNDEQVPRNQQPLQQQDQDVVMKNPRRKIKRGPNMIDQQPEYAVTNNILNQKADITNGQLFKLAPKVATQFRKQAFTRPVINNEQ